MAILNKTLAGPVGERRPCSQFCSVSALIPKTAANLDCDMPSFPRTFTMSVLGFISNTRAGLSWPFSMARACITLSSNSAKSSFFMEDRSDIRHWRIMSTGDFPHQSGPVQSIIACRRRVFCLWPRQRWPCIPLSSCTAEPTPATGKIRCRRRVHLETVLNRGLESPRNPPTGMSALRQPARHSI